MHSRSLLCIPHNYVKFYLLNQHPPRQAAASLLDLVRNGTKVDRRAVMYLLSDMVNRARNINDSQQFGQVSIIQMYYTDVKLNAIYCRMF